MASGRVSYAETLVVGIVPQFTAQQIHDRWMPVLDELSRRTGLTFTLSNHASIPEFEASFLKGAPDLAYMNPYHAVMAHDAAGYAPFVCDGDNRLSGILVVRRDSPFKTIADLAGQQLAFPAPNAFGASLYMRALLAQTIGTDFTANYVSTHSNAYRHVATGRAAAGGGVRRTFEQEPDALKQHLRILFETPESFPHPIAAHPRVPHATRNAIADALVEMGRDPHYAETLKGIQIPRPIHITYAAYESLAELGLENFVVTP